MVANNVIITPETKARLAYKELSPVKKRELREEMIKERIRNTADGACTKQELVAAAGLNPDAHTSEYSKGVGMINSMIKRGIISYLPTHKFRKTWSVRTDVKVKNKPVDKAVIPEKVVVALQERLVTRNELLDVAKDFAWQNNSDSLRDFITYVQNTLK